MIKPNCSRRVPSSTVLYSPVYSINILVSVFRNHLPPVDDQLVIVNECRSTPTLCFPHFARVHFAYNRAVMLPILLALRSSSVLAPWRAKSSAVSVRVRKQTSLFPLSFPSPSLSCPRSRRCAPPPTLPEERLTRESHAYSFLLVYTVCNSRPCHYPQKCTLIQCRPYVFTTVSQPSVRLMLYFVGNLDARKMAQLGRVR